MITMPDYSSDGRSRLARREAAQISKHEAALFKSTYRVQEAAGAEKQTLQMLRLAERRFMSKHLSESLDDLLLLVPASVLPAEVEQSAAEQAALLTRSFSEELLRYIRQYPEAVLTLPGGVFEELIAELLAALGFEEINLRVRTDAGEADILGFSRDVLGYRVGYVFELKQHGRSANRVELREVTRLFGLRESLRLRLGVDRGVFVTTTSYTSPAKQFAEIHRISLKGYEDVLAWLGAYSSSASGLYLRRAQYSV
jgi:restriction endonuclease Mrr